jgi:uncharacterized protein YxjI
MPVARPFARRILSPSGAMATAVRLTASTATSVLGLNDFLVKEHIGLFRAANNYDLYDPENRELVLHCREESLGWITRLLRFSEYKRFTPFDISVRTPEGALLLRVMRGVPLIRSTVEVRGANNELLGTFRQKLFSLGGAFDVLDPTGRLACTLKGKWTGWNFHFFAGETELAHVTKKWAGIGKELFTSADNYMISIAPTVPNSSPVRRLILAAVLCIDMVLKE